VSGRHLNYTKFSHNKQAVPLTLISKCAKTNSNTYKQLRHGQNGRESNYIIFIVGVDG
jgi:hypothetical protein